MLPARNDAIARATMLMDTLLWTRGKVTARSLKGVWSWEEAAYFSGTSSLVGVDPIGSAPVNHFFFCVSYIFTALRKESDKDCSLLQQNNTAKDPFHDELQESERDPCRNDHH